MSEIAHISHTLRRGVRSPRCKPVQLVYRKGAGWFHRLRAISASSNCTSSGHRLTSAQIIFKPRPLAGRGRSESEFRVGSIRSIYEKNLSVEVYCCRLKFLENVSVDDIQEVSDGQWCERDGQCFEYSEIRKKAQDKRCCPVCRRWFKSEHSYVQHYEDCHCAR